VGTALHIPCFFSERNPLFPRYRRTECFPGCL